MAALPTPDLSSVRVIKKLSILFGTKGKIILGCSGGGLGSALRRVLMRHTTSAEVSVKTKGLRDIAKNMVNRSSLMISLRVGASKRV